MEKDLQNSECSENELISMLRSANLAGDEEPLNDVRMGPE